RWDRRSFCVVCRSAVTTGARRLTDHKRRWSVPPVTTTEDDGLSHRSAAQFFLAGVAAVGNHLGHSPAAQRVHFRRGEIAPLADGQVADTDGPDGDAHQLQDLAFHGLDHTPHLTVAP